MPTEAWRRTRRKLMTLADRDGAEGAEGGEGARTELGGWLSRGALHLAGALALTVEAVAAALGPAVEALDATVGWLLSAALFPIEALLGVPYIGRGPALLLRVAVTLFWTAIGLPDAVLAVLGVLPEKRLRLWILLPGGEREFASSERARLLQSLKVAGRILRREANVRLVPALSSHWEYAFSPPELLEAGWFGGAPAGGDPGGLAVACQLDALREELGSVGARIGDWQLRGNLGGAYRRLTGFGAPLMVVPVRSVEGGRLAGCSLGPLVDYVTVDKDRPACLAHEIGHACNLPHLADGMNLMNPTCGGIHLNRWQVALLRLSRHVTYL